MSRLIDLVYLVLLTLGLPLFMLASLRHGKYRDGWSEKFLGAVPRRDSSAPCVWFHAVSVGEVNLLGTLLQSFKTKLPDHQCVISTTTATGYALAQERYSEYRVFYCPLDFSWAVARALDRIRPDLLVLVELELWPNLIHLAHGRGVRIAVINGRLGTSSYSGYRRLRPLISRVLQCVDLIAVQTDEVANRFRKLGARSESVHVTGSMKFDGAQTDRENSGTRRLARLAHIQDGDVVFLAGSTQQPEDEFALRSFVSLTGDHPELRLILVPRHPHRFDEVAALLDRSSVAWQRRSQLNVDDKPHASVTLVDTIGELSDWWGLAHIAFVGGSMGDRGGQNMIEPAAYGAAVSFGPNTRNFRDIVESLLRHDAAVVVPTEQAMTNFVRKCLENRAYRDSLGARARELVMHHVGATDATFSLIRPLLSETATRHTMRLDASHGRPSDSHPAPRRTQRAPNAGV